MSENNVIELNAQASADPGSLDSFRLYLQEIGRYPLLSAQQEAELSSRVLAGLDAAMLLDEAKQNGADLPLDYRCTLEALIDQGLRAREELVTANLRLVVKIAKGYLNRGLSLPDLVQEGNIGLINGAEKYDADRNTRFSTCASKWIEQSIGRAIAAQSSEIRLPEHVYHKVLHMRRLIRELGSDATEEKLAEAMNLSVKQVRNLLPVCSMHLTSLETPVGDEEDGSTLMDFIPDSFTSIESADRELTRESLSAALRKAMEPLDERERYVLLRNYGFGDTEPVSLADIARHLHLTTERVRQVRDSALKKLRRSDPRLAEYL